MLLCSTLTWGIGFDGSYVYDTQTRRSDNLSTFNALSYEQWTKNHRKIRFFLIERLILGMARDNVQ